ncbi:NAD(P)/FAD-dependent oxidoreductase [Psychrobacter sp. ANT_H59]|uniref:NAD(P)/FAD-dependent oxidoreductase n=1 Tax=Psychrobacter sp. ANT_H59 TaxID=2597354 RepID=UPI0011EEAFC4|nr:NADP transhydrogenase subunit alpha [Psychrobacter sp. ANT_H59]KAA0938972.1 NADP transhydrogenase subunit alpha [Psychrobacter sp. ANT_H59]
MTDSTLHTTEQSILKIAIIGGGLTGLFTATLLERAFTQDNANANFKNQSIVPNIVILEKSRSVGRLATRYRMDSATHKNWQWAFGAQFFTAKTADFQQFIKPWLQSNLLQPWYANVVDLIPSDDAAQNADIQAKEQWSSTQARYISTPKMTSWGRALADELKHTTINFKTRVAPLRKEDFVEQNEANNKTELFDENGNSLGSYDWVICTAPNGQAVELMADSNFKELAKISEAQMQACYTLMLGWDKEQFLPAALNTSPPLWDVAYVQDSVLDRIFIEHQKPDHGSLLPSITIHARNDWSEQHVDDDIEAVKAILLQAAKQALSWDENSTPSQIDCHRWRYAATLKPLDNTEFGILVDELRQWIVSGDWCGQGNIESCYQMAKQTVAKICAD